MDSYDVLANFTGNNPYWILAIGGAVAATVQFAAYFVFTAIIRHFGAEEFWGPAIGLGPWFYSVPFAAFAVVLAAMQVVQDAKRKRSYRHTVAVLGEKIIWTAELCGQDKSKIRRLENLYVRLMGCEHGPAELSAYRAALDAAAALFAVAPLTRTQRAVTDSDPRLAGSPAMAMADGYRELRALRQLLLDRAGAALHELEQAISAAEQREEEELLRQDAQRLWLESMDGPAPRASEPGSGHRLG